MSERSFQVEEVSEAALVYIARYRNLTISLIALALQIGLSFGFILFAQSKGWSPIWMAMGPAAALAVSLAVGAVAKAWLATRKLGARIIIFRWPMLLAAVVSAGIGGVATGTPEWSEILIGIPAMLATYLWIIWRFAFKEDDRALFRRQAEA